MQMYPGWHFCEIQRGKPVLRDGSPLEIGRTLRWDGPLVMCQSGYHDSPRLTDALNYAPGNYLCRVLVSADVTDTDKRVSRYRVAAAGFDAERVLFEFAAKIAYCALLNERNCGREPHPASWRAVATRMAWLAGDATDADLAAAGAAAWNAARDAAWNAARDAAWAAAWDAAGDAAGAAAGAAAWAAAGAAAWNAARDAADSLLLSLLPAEMTAAVPHVAEGVTS